MLPIVATLIAQGLGTLGNAVLNKGKDYIEEKLGVDLDKELQTPEGLLKLKQIEVENEQFLITSAIKDKELDISNTTNARDANAKIQDSSNASAIAKNAPYILDFLIVGGTMLLAYFIFFIGIPPQNKDIAFAAFGSLLTLCGTIVNFHRGSSSSSKDKDALLAAMNKKD